jgi:NitT/TauT family transport system substrate-binding protein
MALQVGLDPDKDFHWVTNRKAQPLDLFAKGEIDAFLGFPPEPQELRTRGANHVILSTALDRPWSQYFCCMLAGTSEYVRKYPFATKRVLRAVLMATDLCVTEPEKIARRLVDGGFTTSYEYALQTLRDVPYALWRQDYDAEDTVRFYALRLREAGMITSIPQKIIAEHTEWRFLNELKRELKA